MTFRLDQESEEQIRIGICYASQKDSSYLMQAEKKERVDKSMNKGNMKCNLDKYNGICAADRVTNSR